MDTNLSSGICIHSSLLVSCRLVEELADRTEANSKKQEAHLRVTQKEKNGLVTKLTGVQCLLTFCSSFVCSGDELFFLLTDAKAVILQLEEECTALHKSGR